MFAAVIISAVHANMTLLFCPILFVDEIKFKTISGTVIDSRDFILLEDVPIITPNGDIVVNSLSLKVSHFF